MALLTGTSGGDSLVGGAGDDSILGLGGNDTLSDAHGNDTLDGGAGNDVIAISRNDTGLTSQLHETVSIAGGDGDDSVSFDISWGGNTGLDKPLTASLLIDLGAGNDSFFLDDTHAAATVTLGAGQDRIELGEFYLSSFEDLGAQSITVNDFVAGNAGDVLDIGGMLIATGWNRTDNPFASGQLRLLQQGADAIVAVDYDGVGGNDQLEEVFRLVGVDSSTLTAFNFAGFDPHRTPAAALVVSAGAGADTLFGGAAGDTLSGGAGNDELLGGFGNDSLDGGSNDDALEGGYGNDLIVGGAGNDLIEDLHGGSDSLVGGDGDDEIVVRHRPFWGVGGDAISIDAGGGADSVDFTIGFGTLVASLGDGDDRITLHSYPTDGAILALGAGSDVVVLDPFMASQVRGLIQITDFQAGDGGDQLDWLAFAAAFTFTNVPGFNPFALGLAQLTQSGADTQLLLKQGAAPATAVIVFKNTSVASFTDFNFGTDIHAAPPIPEAPTHTGTSGADTLTGTAQRDIMSGLAGNDTLTGLGGNDVLKGGTGSDLVNGGDGDDVIEDLDGADTIVGGAGNDTITVGIEGFPQGGNTDAGDGDDVFLFQRSGGLGVYTVSLGAGNDHLRVAAIAANMQISLGAGQDTIELPAYFSSYNSSDLIVTDFQAGNAGDAMDLDGFLDTYLPLYWRLFPGQNPFQLGYLELRQVGADVELRVNRLATDLSGALLARFVGTTLDQFTAANFGGYDPHVQPKGAKVIKTSTVIGAGETDAALNTTPAENLLRPHYIYASQDAQFINHGTVTTVMTKPGDALVGLIVSSSGSQSSFVNASDGSFVVQENIDGFPVVDPFTHAYGMYAGAASISFRNDGYFEVGTTGGVAKGIVTGYDNFHAAGVVNNGSFSVHSAYAAIGVELGFGGSFENNGDFTITGSEFAIGLYIGQYHAQAIVNNGTMTVTNDPDSPWASVAFLLPEIEAPFSGSYQHWNTGTITANYAYYIYEVNLQLGGFVDVLHNSGQIFGAVALGRGNDVIENTGTMTGRSFLGEGNDRYDGRQGFHSGSIEGELGDDTLLGGLGDENLFGDSGDDSIDGGDGDDYIDGGAGSDSLQGGGGIHNIVSYVDSLLPVVIDLTAGTANTSLDRDHISGFQVAVGSRCADTLRGSAYNDALLGFLGNDVLDGRAGDDIFLGGRGADTLTGGAGDDRFLFDISDGADEIADFSAGDSIEVYGYDGYQSLVQAGADVLITLAAGDSIRVRNATAAAVSAATFFIDTPLDVGVPNFEFEPLRVDADLVIGAGVEFSLGDTRPQVSFDPLPASTEVFLYSFVGLWNSGALAIATSDGGFTTRGVAIAPQAASSTQQLINRAGASISVIATASDAVGVGSISKVWNQGTIQVESAWGDATGVGDMASVGSAFVNSGTIQVTALGSAHGVGQNTGASMGVSAYSNSGLVAVDGGLASTGFELRLSSFQPQDHPTFVNTGTIVVTDGTSTLDSVALGVNLAVKASVWNSGTLSADFAIRVTPAESGAVPSRPYGLELFNSGSISGLVYLSTWGDLVVNTGSISGSVFLGGGDDFYDGRPGSLTGTLDGYDGNDTLLGGAGADRVDGGFGNDVLSGGVGDDVLAGGAGSDSFHFRAGDGHDAIADFETGAGHDFIDVEGYAAYQSITQSGADALIVFSATDSLVLRSISVGAISADMFRFNAAAIGASTISAAPAALAAPAEPVYDDMPPVVLSFLPADEATGVARNANVVVVFNEAIARGSNVVVLARADGPVVEIFDAATSGRISISGNTLTLDPTFDLAYATDFKIDFIAGSVTDLNGNAYAGTSSYNFRTMPQPDTTPPVVTSFLPTQGGGAVATTSSFLLVFSETVMRGAGNIVLKTAAGAVVESFNATNSGRLTLDGNTVLIDPTADLLGGTAYRIEVAAGTLVDVAGNGVAVSGPYNFTTAAAIVNGTSANDTLLGGAGVDVLTGDGGDDSINGGAGTDTAVFAGAFGQYQITYDSATQRFVFTDTIAARDGIDTVTAVENFQFTDGTRTAASISAMFGTAGNDTFNGTSAADTYSGLAGNDSINGNAGDDTLSGGPGNDVINGGAGRDTAVYAGAAAVSVNLSLVGGQNTGGAGTDTLTGIENLVGSDGADSLFGDVTANRLEGGLGNDTLDGNAGDDTLVGGAGNDRYGVDSSGDLIVEAEGQGVDTVAALISWTLGANLENLELLFGASLNATGNALDNALTGNAGANALVGLAGNDTLLGAAGSDTLTGGLGGDILDGGDGLDYAVYAGPRSAYAISHTVTGFVVSANSDVNDVDTLSTVERLVFSDAKLALDILGNAGQAYRLYQAAFDRVPDIGGLGYQMNELDRGMALTWVASNFIASPEFNSTYGALTNTQFVTQLYRNVLDREPDSGGLAYHLDRMAHGVGREYILVGFSESPENQANVIGAIENGMVYVL